MGDTKYSTSQLAARRDSLLAQLVTVVTEAKNYPAALQSCTAVLTHTLCDWAAIDLRELDGHVSRVAHAHADDRKQPLLERLKREYPPGSAANRWINTVLESGNPIVAQNITIDSIRERTRDEKFASLIEELGIDSCALFPMVVDGKAVGAITFVSASRFQPFGEHDFPLLEEIAGIVGRIVSGWSAFQRVARDLELREQFVSIVSHELKTPLTALHSMLQLLLMHTRRGKPLNLEQTQHVLESAEKQTHRMTQLINDLLDMSRISAGRLVLKRDDCCMMRIIHEVRERMETQMRASGSTLTVRGPESIPGCWDRSRMEEVVTNLISNAFKYGKGQPIEIEAEAYALPAGGGEFIRLKVVDHGPGIASEDQERIFDVFERAAHSQDTLGHGLGLYIVRKILEAHRGTIRVQSALGAGSAFVCEFPRN